MLYVRNTFYITKQQHAFNAVISVEFEVISRDE